MVTRGATTTFVQRRIGDVAGGETDSHQQIHGLFLFREQNAVGDLVRRDGHLHIALVLRVTLLRYIALDVVRVAIVGTHSDHVWLSQLRLNILLRHHKITHHPARLTDVKLVWPVLVVRELVLR